MSEETKRTVVEAASWAAFVAATALSDIWLMRLGQPPLSEGHREAVSSPAGAICVAAAEAVLVCHLWQRPRRFARLDPISRLARRYGAAK